MWQDSRFSLRTARHAGPGLLKLAATSMRHAAQIFRQVWSRRGAPEPRLFNRSRKGFLSLASDRPGLALARAQARASLW